MEIVKNTQTIITNFTNLIDINKKYSNKELVNILNKVYNDVYKKKRNQQNIIYLLRKIFQN